MNDGEGLRCLEKAETAFCQKQYTVTIRLAQKALRMLSNESTISRDKARELVLKAEHRLKASATPNFSSSSSPGSTSQCAGEASTAPSGQDKRDAPTSQHAGSKNFNSQSPVDSARRVNPPDYDPALEAKCKKICESKNYYEILNVTQTASPEDVKRAYRKLALQFHPDKAKCPSAEAAFKVLAKAYQCLADKDAKRHYDAYGVEQDDEASDTRRDPYDAHFMSPEELFESLFGVRFVRSANHSHRVFRVHHGGAARSQSYRGSGHGGEGPSEAQRVQTLFQLVPLLIIIVISMLSNMFQSPSNPSPFSFSRSSEYSVPRTTTEYGLRYFVRPDFSRTYAQRNDRLRELEGQIEMNYFLAECQREQQPLLQQLQNLRFYGTVEQYRRKTEELRRKEESSSNCINYKKLKAHYSNPKHASHTMGW